MKPRANVSVTAGLATRQAARYRYHVSKPVVDQTLWRGIAIGMVFEAVLLLVAFLATGFVLWMISP